MDSYVGNTTDIHAISTQVYRWFTFYERTMLPQRITNQLDILADDIQITAPSGTIKGKPQYQQFIKVYEGWKNAHHVRAITIAKDGKADVEIQFQSVQPNNTSSEVVMTYHIGTARKGQTDLPLLEDIAIRPVGQDELLEFKDTYATNRAKALMHYWLFNIEQSNGSPLVLRELLAPTFELQLSKDKCITNVTDFNHWIKTATTQVIESNHYPENVTVNVLDNANWELNAEFVWRGKDRSGAELKAHTMHKWHIVDDINHSFAKIKKMEVSYKIPFSPLKTEKQ